MDESRRKFIGTCCAAGAVGLLSLAGLGCSKNDEGGNPAGPNGGTYDVNLDDYPQLAADNTAVHITGSPLGRAILLVHVTGETYRALDSRCTHNGCTVGATSPTLNCPCHGSRFRFDGTVAQGPAAAPLPTYPVTKNGSILTIDFGSPT